MILLIVIFVCRPLSWIRPPIALPLSRERRSLWFQVSRKRSAPLVGCSGR